MTNLSHTFSVPHRMKVDEHRGYLWHDRQIVGSTLRLNNIDLQIENHDKVANYVLWTWLERRKHVVALVIPLHEVG